MNLNNDWLIRLANVYNYPEIKRAWDLNLKGKYDDERMKNYIIFYEKVKKQDIEKEKMRKKLEQEKKKKEKEIEKKIIKRSKQTKRKLKWKSKKIRLIGVKKLSSRKKEKIIHFEGKGWE